MNEMQTIEDNSVEIRCSSAGKPGYMDTFEWMRVIYACGRIRPGMFGEPLEFHQREGFHTEEYADARVIFHREQGYVLVQSKTAEGAEALRAAWAEPGVRKSEAV